MTGLITVDPQKLTAEEELYALLNLREQKGRMNEYDRIVKLLKDNHYHMAVALLEAEE